MATILIIDDDPDALSILETFLRSRGHDVHGATSGVEGLGRLDELAPDLVILDVMMPGMDGWEVARRIRGHPRYADGRILMLSARDDEPGTAGGEVETDGYLVKPVGLEALEQRINAILSDGSDPGAAAS